jgi:hypothetical protein
MGGSEIRVQRPLRSHSRCRLSRPSLSLQIPLHAGAKYEVLETLEKITVQDCFKQRKSVVLNKQNC